MANTSPVFKNIEVEQLEDEELTVLYACLKILEESSLDSEEKARVTRYLSERHSVGETYNG